MKMEDLPQIEIKDGKLLISIGIDALIFGVTHGRYFDNYPEGEQPKVTNKALFADAIRCELEREEEDGTTLLYAMLDKAAENAIEDGCDGIDGGD
jgi:hypothetical protein